MILFRLLTAVVYLATTAALGYRLRQAWAYAGSRWLLVALSIPIPLIAIGSYQALKFDNRVGPASYAITAAGVLLLVVCIVWPDSRRQRDLVAKMRRLEELESRFRGDDPPQA